MTVQKVFKSGNSHVVTIPPHFMKKLDIKEGEKVVVEEAPTQDSLVIRKSSTKSSGMDELKKWFDNFLKENKEILDELAVR